MLAARKKANWILAAILIPLTLLTLAAMAFMWPSGSKEGITLASPYAAAPGVTFDTGKIQRVVVGSCSDAQAGGDAAAQQGTSGSGAAVRMSRPAVTPPSRAPPAPAPRRSRRTRALNARSPTPSRTRAATR